MDTRLILIRAIILLYREGQLGLKSDGSGELVKRVFSSLRAPTARMESDFGKDVITYLRTTVQWMLNAPLGSEFDRNDILERIRVGTNGHEYLYEVVEEGTRDEHDEPDREAIENQCVGIRREFNNFLLQQNVRRVVNEAHSKIAYHSESVDWNSYVQELREALEPFESIREDDEDHPAMVAGFKFSEVSKMVDVLNRGKEQVAEGGSIRYGWKGLNRMFGSSYGSRRGEFIITPALQHNFKSGLNMMTMIHHAKYNEPHTLFHDQNLTPTLVRISFENDAELDILTIYKFLYEADHEVKVDIRDTDPTAAAEYIDDRMSKNGWEIILYRFDPSDFGYNDLFQLLTKLRTNNHEIFGLWIDYPGLMSKKNCVTGPAGVEFRDLIRRIRNYTTRHAITVWAPWQLSTEAKMKIREGTSDFLAEIVGKGYYDSCRTIDQEVDMEIYIHIYKLSEDVSWLGFRRGKHRKFDITPPADMAFYIPFQEIGTLKEDVNLPEDTSRRKLARGVMDVSDEILWD